MDLEEYLKTLEESVLVKEFLSLKEKLLKDKSFLKDIKISREKQDIIAKQKLFENKDFKRYKTLENELYLLSLSLNQKLNTLIKGSDDHACHKWKV